jgi:hypothetical protein
MVAQADGAEQGGDPTITRSLDAGSYFVAVSGAGNRYFNPLLADSGTIGRTGAYDLQLQATDLQLDPTAGPLVLTADPAPGAVLDHSPLVLRVSLAEPSDTSTALVGALDPSSVDLGNNLTLTYNPTGNFGDGNDQDVPLAGFNFSTAIDELQIIPQKPLGPGFYQLFLGGDCTNPNWSPLVDVNGVPLGTDTADQYGQDYTISFQVAGVKGNTSPDAGAQDTPDTARNLGDVTHEGLVQAAGVIGDDPFYSIQRHTNRSDVDLYHFQISGPGRYAFVAEVFAGRIGSPLAPAVSLYVMDPTNHTLHLISADDGTLNGTLTSNGRNAPLSSDSVLYAGLTAGDYYLAISSHKNVPNAALGYLPGMVVPGIGRIFDPMHSHSGTAGTSTGDYVLNLQVEPDGPAPQVIALSPAGGSVLSAPPTQLVVQFSCPMNLQQLAYQAYLQTTQNQLSPVYIQAANGTRYYPRLISYDPDSGQATFQILDALPNDIYQLHLSGPLGLEDFAGDPLVGNDPSGDFISPFTVQATPRGTNGNPLVWTSQVGNNNLQHAQDLGVLFPRELAQGVTIQRQVLAGPTVRDTAEYFRFQVTQTQSYFFLLTYTSMPSATLVTLLDAAGDPVATVPQHDGSLLAILDPGTYVIRMEGWAANQSPGLGYQLQLHIGRLKQDPQPLTNGPAPAVRLRLVSDAVPAPTASTRVTPPGTSSTSTTAPTVRIATAAGQLRTAEITLADSVSLATGSALAFTVPADILAALRAGPVGGINTPNLVDAPAAPDRVEIKAPDSLREAEVLRLTILTQASGFSGETSSAKESSGRSGAQVLNRLTNLLEQGLRDVAHNWEGVLDALFGTESWLPTVEQGPVLEEDVLSGDGESDLQTSAWTPQGPAADDSEGLWAKFGPALGLVALAAPPRDRRRAGPAKGPRT